MKSVWIDNTFGIVALNLRCVLIGDEQYALQVFSGTQEHCEVIKNAFVQVGYTALKDKFTDFKPIDFKKKKRKK
jgi:hypothetical protein